MIHDPTQVHKKYVHIGAEQSLFSQKGEIRVYIGLEKLHKNTGWFTGQETVQIMIYINRRYGPRCNWNLVLYVQAKK